VFISVAGVTAWYLWDAITGWRLFWFIFATSTTFVWIGILVKWAHYSMPNQERERPSTVNVSNVSYNQTTTRVELIQNNGQWGDWLDVPIPTEKIIAVAEIIVTGGDFTYACLAGRGKALTMNEYSALRTFFISKGLAVWINPAGHNQGCALTGSGRAIMRRFAELPPPQQGEQPIEIPYFLEINVNTRINATGKAVL